MKIIRVQFLSFLGVLLAQVKGEGEKPLCRRDGMVEVSLKESSVGVTHTSLYFVRFIVLEFLISITPVSSKSFLPLSTSCLHARVTNMKSTQPNSLGSCNNLTKSD